MYVFGWFFLCSVFTVKTVAIKDNDVKTTSPQDSTILHIVTRFTKCHITITIIIVNSNKF